jgi:hypothetical protein
MSDLSTENSHEFTHTLTVFSVSAAMIGVCLTAIGLVKIVSHATKLETLCDDLIVIDAMIFGFAALSGFMNLRRFVGHRTPISRRTMDWTFAIGLALMIVICGLFAWSLL